jgi:hypothetical protein
MASHKRRQVVWPRSPTTYATTCRVLRHSAIRIQAWFVFFSTNDHSSSNSSTVASTSLASGSISVSLKADSLAFFLSRRSPSSVRPQRSVPDHANCCALHRLVGSLLDVLLDRHRGTDSPGIVFDRHGRDISASRWGLDHYAPRRRSCNADNEV